MSDRSATEFGLSLSGSFSFFRVPNQQCQAVSDRRPLRGSSPGAMLLGAHVPPVCRLTADSRAQLSEPHSRPGKLQTEDGKAGGNHEESRTRRDKHHDTKEDNGDADNQDDDSAGKLVGEFNQNRGFPLIRLSPYHETGIVTMTLGVLMPLA